MTIISCNSRFWNWFWKYWFIYLAMITFNFELIPRKYSSYQLSIKSSWFNFFEAKSYEPVIPNSKYNTKGHVNDTENDGDFHFVGIEIGDFVFSKLPHRIHTEGVWILRVVAVARVGDEHFVRHRTQLFRRQINFICRSKDVKRFWKDVIVNDSRVDGKYAHQQYDVTSREADCPNLLFQSLKIRLISQFKKKRIIMATSKNIILT